jgi:hypothetical protein
MSPYHTGFVRELRTTTALQGSASWLASENTRAIREASGEPYELVTPDFYGGLIAEAAIEQTKAEMKAIQQRSN